MASLPSIYDIVYGLYSMDGFEYDRQCITVIRSPDDYGGYTNCRVSENAILYHNERDTIEIVEVIGDKGIETHTLYYLYTILDSEDGEPWVDRASSPEELVGVIRGFMR